MHFHLSRAVRFATAMEVAFVAAGFLFGLFSNSTFNPTILSICHCLLSALLYVCDVRFFGSSASADGYPESRVTIYGSIYCSGNTP